LVLSSSDGPNRFSARFNLRDAQWGHEDLALEAGAYSVRFIPPGEDVTKSHWLLSSRTLADGLPVRLDGHRSVLELSRTEKNGALKVFVKPRFTERSEEHTSELQSRFDLVCRLLLAKKKNTTTN